MQLLGIQQLPVLLVLAFHLESLSTKLPFQEDFLGRFSWEKSSGELRP